MKPKINLRLYLIVFAISLAVLFLRNTSAFLYPQFWAEDGKVWYAEAHNLGWFPTLFKYHIDYFQTISRLTGSVAQAFGLEFAPLVFILVSVVIQTLPVLFLFSRRLDKLIPNFSVKVLLASIYLLLPNTAETRISLTYAQWYFALMACMVLLGTLAETFKQKLFDSIVLIVTGLSGPYVIFLFPIAFIQWWKSKHPWRLVLFLIAATCSVIQTAFILLFSHGGRTYPKLGMDFSLFFSILNRQVFTASIIGQRGYVWVLNHVSFHSLLFAAVTFLSLLLIVYAIFKARLEQKLFICFGALIYCASLFSPSIPDFSKTAWQVLYSSDSGIRYWFIPMLAFITVLLLVAQKNTPLLLRGIALVFLAGMLIGAVADFNQNIYVDMHFPKYAQEYQNSAPGQKITIPINPPGWSMELIKH